MTFFKQKTNIIFLFVIFMLVALLAGVSYFAYDKNKEYQAVSASLTDNSSELDAAQSRIDELTKEIEKYTADAQATEQQKAELNSKLQSALEEKARLEQENSKLKNQLEELAAKKRREELQAQIA